jgi:Zn-dependent protease/predicted transcriptional regulator
MFGKPITLFRMFGFAVRIDMSWLIIVALVTWSLAEGVFPFWFKNLSKITYWWMGIAGALGLFVAIVFHELSHSLVARKYGLPMKGITLFIFGGVAEMGEEAPSAKAEFMMAIAGPISSIVFALVCFGLYMIGGRAGWPVPLIGVLGYLMVINMVLVAFNLIPGFPLDGGRVLRSALWYWKKNLRWATRVASRIGEGFGTALIILGIFVLLYTGNFIGGIWWILIGMFLRGAARQSYQHILMRQALEGEHVRRFMNPNPVTVSSSISIAQLVEDFIYKYHYKMFPVVDNGRLIGCVTIQQVKEVPRDKWSQQTVGELASSCSDENTIRSDEDAMKALSIMSRTRASRLMVVDGNQLVGIISLKDLLKFFSLKVELEEGER